MFFRRGSRFRGKRAANRKKTGKNAPFPPQGGKRFMRAERYYAAKTPLLRRGAAKDRAMRPAFF